MAGERAKDNKTLTAPCGACGKATPTAQLIGLAVGDEGRKRKTVPVCPACRDKGWRPEGYRGM